MSKRYEGNNPLAIYYLDEHEVEERRPEDLINLKLWNELTPSPLAGVNEYALVRARGRLFRTIDGVMYAWGGNIAISSLATAHPFIDLCFREATIRTRGWHSWPSPESDDALEDICEQLQVREESYIYQGGKMVDAPLLISSPFPVTDMTFREEREDIMSLAEIMPRGAVDEQGDLRIQFVLAEVETLEELCEECPHLLRNPMNKPYIVGDHAIEGVRSYVGLDDQRLIYVPERAIVTSPNHSRSQVTLEEGIYLLFHPSRRNMG